MQASLKRLLRSPLVIAIAALVLRLAILYVTWHRAAPAAFTEPYGYETGSVARSISLGHGFSSPLPLLETGPTAWLAPIYPYILAGIFKVWGVYSLKSHLVAQALNCLFSALVVFPIFAIAKRSFGVTTAVLAAWLWVILPNAWHIPIADIWDTTLSALWLALILWMTLALRDRQSLANWAVYGALWAAGALLNPSMLAVMPFLFCWLVWRARKRANSSLWRAAVALAVFALGMAPWTIRNYRVFGKFLPVRSVFGITLWMGNNPIAVGVNSFPMLPTLNLGEAEKFKQTGEVNYARAKGEEALSFIDSHPAIVVRHVLHDFASFWFSVSDRPNGDWRTAPRYVKSLLIANAIMILICWFGIILAWHSANPHFVLYATVLLFFPLVYYLTFSLVRYRFTVDPLITILFAYSISQLASGPFSKLN